MKISELKYSYPENLIATVPSRPSRVMWVDGQKTPDEINIPQLLQRIPAGDILVINNTKVLKRRVFSVTGIEILFLNQIETSAQHNTWKVLFPSKKMQVGEKVKLPLGFELTLLQKGRPQVVEIRPPLSEADFEAIAELPLPPYIQKAREQRHTQISDEAWYQSAWARKPGSFAAPTASLHFTQKDLDELKNKGVEIIEVTLHVGLGTFLPVTTEDLNQHQMHNEFFEISENNWQKINQAKKEDRKIWALGTTTTRVLETVARERKVFGETDILLQVGSEFKIVDRLMTNFHQPESTLLALVAGFAGLEKVKDCYQWAIAKKFKLFSYGDFSIWLK